MNESNGNLIKNSICKYDSIWKKYWRTPQERNMPNKIISIHLKKGMREYKKLNGKLLMEEQQSTSSDFVQFYKLFAKAVTCRIIAMGLLFEEYKERCFGKNYLRFSNMIKSSNYLQEKALYYAYHGGYIEKE
ncbi:hypothetical protein HCA15_03665 [Listeria booriae]|uniref:hypothetical protein n=1 Tax=Listeria booriae TaxID=1552123 RepID=UPI00164E23BF|nr:hypothetical protein [Listeria booriae]MBC6165734.1 hypothetical protein [Listeria booriae]